MTDKQNGFSAKTKRETDLDLLCSNLIIYIAPLARGAALTMYFIDCSQNLRKLVTTPEPECIISFFCLRITPISYLACCTLTCIN